ncbi:fibronectin-like, partial [Ruditapes philippinarum]|uniref:fibronectin-like n=1 Tax=Ruditapes philippinarum TaxID=129788 RepID=UPI00295BCC1D
MVIVYYFVRPKFTNIEILKDTKIHILWTDRLYCCRWCQPIFGYNIVCNPIKGQERDTICRTHSTKKNNYTLRDLDPMAIYEISLSRKLCCFKSSATKRYVITRKAGMLNDQGYDAKSTSIDVWWTKPDCINNLQLKYQVTCNELKTEHSETDITINDLIPGEMYKIEVFAIDKGTNVLILAKEISTTPNKPTDLDYTASSRQIELIWKIPENAGRQQLEYEVTCNE